MVTGISGSVGLTSAGNGSVVPANNGAPATVTIPLAASQPFITAGTQMQFIRKGAGGVQFILATPAVQVYSPGGLIGAGGLDTIAQTGSSVLLIKGPSEEWYLSGDLI
jgi:hypothetical protein